MLTISTFNIQNDIRNYTKEKTDALVDYILKNHIDIIGLQEVYKKLDIDLEKALEENHYKTFGKYRFFSKLILGRINEKTPVVTSKKVMCSKTYHLPHLPSLLKRVMTKIEILVDGRRISFYNTHLDYQFNFVKKRQLKKIINIIKKDTNPIILTGDFNLKTNNKVFLDFIQKLKEINIFHIDIKESTFKASKYHKAIDHIFLSDDFLVLEKRRIDDLSISDHYPVLMKIKWK